MPDSFDAPPIPDPPAPIVDAGDAMAFCEAVGLTPTQGEVAQAIELATATLEDVCRVRFRSKTHTETVTVEGGTLIAEPMVTAVTAIDGEPVTMGPFHSGVITGLPNGQIEITYQHGWATAPARIKRACLLLVRHILTEDPTDLDSRATFKSNELASWSLVTPGVKGAVTPIPEVNQIIVDYAFTQDIV